MIKGVGISKEFDNQTILKNVNFHIKYGDKVALIGRNGTGKSTLFKIILGTEKPTEGKILLDNEKIGYLQQEFDFDTEMMIGEYMEEIAKKENDYWRIEKLIGQMGLEIDEYQKIGTLSGGEKMRLKIASILYNEPTTLLLDEPTNHLDISGILWLQNFIKSFKGSIVIISHDRNLLNKVVDRIFEIDEKQILDFSGNYDSYQEKKQKWVENRDLEFNRFMERKKKLEILLKKAQAGIIRSRTGNATEAAKKRIDREINKREVLQYERKKYSELNIAGGTHTSKLILRVSNAVKNFGDKNVLNDISFELRGNEKVWLFGNNGEGKTTLVKCILGEEELNSGSITIGDNVNIGYFEQKQKKIDISEKLHDYYMRNAKVSFYEVPKVLSKYLFTSEDLIKPVKLLSPGQQARLKFAIFTEGSIHNPYQFLILDEPAQHLDIETKEVIERAITEFKGAVLLISHDIYSIQCIDIDRSIKIENGSISIF